MSSVAAYGDGLNHAEDDPLASDIHTDAYVRNKASSERALFRMYHESAVSGGYHAAAVRLWPGESVLSRGVSSGTA